MSTPCLICGRSDGICPHPLQDLPPPIAGFAPMPQPTTNEELRARARLAKKLDEMLPHWNDPRSDPV